MLLGSLWCTGAIDASEPFELQVLSSTPDTVSGGDALVKLTAPDRHHWTVELDGHDITALFRPVAGSSDRLALIKGIKDGGSTLSIRPDGSSNRTTLKLQNHSLSGPIFSGPHQKPFICQTVDNGLGPPIDSDCEAETVVQYYYKSTDPAPVSLQQQLEAVAGDKTTTSFAPGFNPYAASSTKASDMAQVVTTEGKKVKYVVRREIGTINRAVYDIQLLHEPGQRLPTPWTGRTPGWNGRLVYIFWGGCGAGHRQGKLVGGAIGKAQESLLSQGYAVATSTLNSFSNDCNSRLSAETLSMVKEHFIKEFGRPTHTIGWGISGGATQQYLIAQQHPGLLDGIITSASFPDILNAVQSSSDCELLEHAFVTSRLHWTEEQKARVSGFATWRTCTAGWKLKFINPTNCDLSIPRQQVYDPIRNVGGVRCDFFDDEVNVFGRDSRTGFAHRALDNVGVQYGLRALQQSAISAEQFIELNEKIGGHDRDGDIVATRTAADPQALLTAYEEGVVLTGGGGLSQVPTIDWRPYLDDLADGHDILRSFVTRARLIAANGSADSQVILVDPTFDTFNEFVTSDATTSLYSRKQRELVRQMDLWLDNIAADSSPGTLANKITRDKPPELAEGCWQVNGGRIAESAAYDGSGRCSQMYPSHGDPRLVAGAPLTDDVLKCALKPLNATDYYPQPVSADQIRRLERIFPDGVCDYDRPGMGQQMIRMTLRQNSQVIGH
jgi:hypothetical protein